ncbi:MAG TPA: alpha/beta hydrolase [Terriglobales bacterium]
MAVLKRNNVKVLGEGMQPMIFAHGYGCEQNTWREVTPAFQRDHKVVLFDHVGAGDSDLKAFDRDRYATLDGYATDVLEICAELQLQNVVFVGHSVSAMIGVLAAIRQPDLFTKLVLIGPSPCYLNDGDYHGGFDRGDIDGLLDFLDSNYLGWSATMAPVIMGNPERPELANELANSFCRTDPEIAKHFARVTFLSDNRADLPKLKTPSIILQCSEDSIAPPPVGQYVHSQLADSSLILMQATGHCPHLSAPAETISAIRDGLKVLLRPTGS